MVQVNVARNFSFQNDSPTFGFAEQTGEWNARDDLEHVLGVRCCFGWDVAEDVGLWVESRFHGFDEGL